VGRRWVGCQDEARLSRGPGWRMIDVPDFGLGGRRSQVSERRHARDDEKEKEEQEERLPVLGGWVWM